MSNVQVETKSIVTIPSAVSKVITGVNVAGVIQSVLPAGIVGTIKPRDISMSHETARAAIGAKASPKAVIVGLSYLTLAYAYGQGKPETLTKGCPSWAVHGLSLACQYFKAGAGNVTVDALSTAVQSAVDTLLTLPKPIKAKSVNAPTITVPVIESKVDDVLTENQIDRINLSADIADKRANENLAIATQAHVDAIAEAEAKAKSTAESQKQQEGVDVVRLIAEMRDKDQAVMLIRAMAAHFGFTLVDMELPQRIAAQSIIGPHGPILVSAFDQGTNQNHPLFKIQGLATGAQALVLSRLLVVSLVRAFQHVAGLALLLIGFVSTGWRWPYFRKQLADAS